MAMAELGLGGSRLSMAIANGCNWGLNCESTACHTRLLH